MNMRPFPPVAAVPAWTPHLPAALDPRHLTLVNALATWRVAIPITELGPDFWLHIDGIGAATEMPPDALSFGIRLPAGRLRLVVAREWVVRLVERVQPGIGLVDEPLRSMLLMLALAPALDRLEQIMVGAVGIEPDRAASPCAEEAIRVAIRIEDGKNIYPALLSLPCADLHTTVLFSTLLRIFNEIPIERRDLRELTFEVPVRIEAGAVFLTLAQLSSLRPGDVLVPDRPSLASQSGQVRVGALAAPAEIEASKVCLTSGLASHQEQFTERTMTDDQRPAGTAPGGEQEDAAIDSLPINVTFELGRRDMSLAELRSLGPGYVFDLGKALEEPVDILANGRRIGRGEIVRIGETLGVRALRLFDHG
jgi:type III secretion protein Q